MDLRQLQMLRALGDLGSVTAVAESLHVTPSAVSQQLRLLQRTCGVPLTRREQRRLVLTEAGARLAAAAVEVAAALARADEVAHNLAGTAEGTVSVAGFNSAALAFFPRLVPAFTSADPVTVTVADEDTSQSDFPALTARYDIVIGHRFDHTPPWPDTVRVLPLLNEPLDVAMPTGHALADAGRLTAAAVADEPWITTHSGWPVGAFVDTLAAVSGRPIEVRHRVNEFTVAAELVRAGAGLALIPRWTSPPPEGVVLRQIEGIVATRRVDALTRPENEARAAVRAVLAELHRIAGLVARPATNR
jgi:DNA-binding transcriptional LysR family regulator